MSNEFIDGHLSKNNLVWKLGNIFNWFPSSKCGSFPLTSCHKLEWSSCKLLACSSNTNYHWFAKASVGHFESLSHDGNIASAVICEINAPFLVFKEPFFGVMLFWIDTVGCTEFFSNREFIVVYVNSIDAGGSFSLCSLDDSKTNSTQTPNGNGAASMEIRVIEDCTPSSRDSTSKNTSLEGVTLWINLCKRDRGKDSVLRERRATHKVVNHLTIHCL